MEENREVRRYSPLFFLLAGAFLYRLLIFYARGDFVGFDEGWYMLLAQSLASGEGYTLNGSPHTTFSPLWPFLLGGGYAITGELVWTSRVLVSLVGAITLWPLYILTKRFLSGSILWLALILAAIAPPLVSFIPYWGGRELFVGGSEPLWLLLFIATMALWGRTTLRAGVTGVLMGLAFYTRPEAIGAAAIVGLFYIVPRGVKWHRALVHGVVYGALVWGVMTPYLFYLHEVTGRWTLSGRGVAVGVLPDRQRAEGAVEEAGEKPGARDAVRELLWTKGNEWQFLRGNFTLDPTGTRLRSNFIGVEEGGPGAEVLERMTLSPPVGMRDTAQVSANIPSEPVLYLKTMDLLLDWRLWIFVVFGFGIRVVRRRVGEIEALWAVSSWGISMAVAVLVYIDPRNHLILVPWVFTYLGIGVWEAVTMFHEKFLEGRDVNVTRWAVAGLLTFGIVTTPLANAYKGIVIGSPFHLIGTEHKMAGEVLGETVVEGENVMSWHPAVAIFAGRPWRALPYEPLPVVFRYAALKDTRYVVLSKYNPSPLTFEEGTTAGYFAFVISQVEEYHPDWRVEFLEKVSNVAFMKAEIILEDEEAGNEES